MDQAQAIKSEIARAVHKGESAERGMFLNQFNNEGKEVSKNRREGKSEGKRGEERRGEERRGKKEVSRGYKYGGFTLRRELLSISRS